MKLILQDSRILAEAGDGYDGPMEWIAAPEGYVPGSFRLPGAAPEVPHKVTRRQARQALLLAGKLALVQPAIDAIEDAQQRGLAQIDWDDAQEFERHHPLLIHLATALGLDDEALDNLFIQAASL